MTERELICDLKAIVREYMIYNELTGNMSDYYLDMMRDDFREALKTAILEVMSEW